MSSFEETYKEMSSVFFTFHNFLLIICQQFVVANGGCFDENVNEIQRNSKFLIKPSNSNKEQLSTALELMSSVDKKKTFEVKKESKRCNTEESSHRQINALRYNEEKTENFEFQETTKQFINSKQLTE